MPRSSLARASLAIGGVAVAASLAAQAWGLAGLMLVAKPIPVLCLAASLAPWSGRVARLVAAGLVVCALGDLLLELPGRFVAGLSAFLLGHLAYVAAFAGAGRAGAPGRAVLFAAWGGGAYVFLYPRLGSMALPVGAYVLVIAVMMWRASALLGGPAGRLAAAGAVLFGLSDTLLALDRFHEPVPGARPAILLLYWAGQLGIALWARARIARSSAPEPPA